MHLVIHTCRTSASCAWRGGAARLPRRLDAEQLLGPKVELTIDFDFCRSEAPATSVWVVPPNNEDDGVMGVGLLLQQVRAEEVDVVAPPGLEPLPLDPTTRHESMAEDVKHLQARRHSVCMCSLSTPHEPIFYGLPIPEAAGAAQHPGTRARVPQECSEAHEPQPEPKERSNSPKSRQEASSGRTAARRAAGCSLGSRRAASPKVFTSLRYSSFARCAALVKSKYIRTPPALSFRLFAL